MSYLVDTNVILRSVQKTHPMQLDSSRSFELLIHRGEIVSVIPQNLIEFWAVATRPPLNNGLGMSADEAAQHIAVFKSALELLPDTDSIFIEWEQLVIRHKVLGKQVYDASCGGYACPQPHTSVDLQRCRLQAIHRDHGRQSP